MGCTAAFQTPYWPAHYLIDADGVVRHISPGEGGYENTERLIRELLAEADPGAELPTSTTVADSTPRDEGQTPETFLSVGKKFNDADDGYTKGPATYDLPTGMAAYSFTFR